MMSFTDYAGVAGLIAATAVAIWMLRNHRTIAPTARHRGAPTLRLPRPTRPERFLAQVVGKRAGSSGAVVVDAGDDVDSVVSDPVDETVLRIDPPRPVAGELVP